MKTLLVSALIFLGSLIIMSCKKNNKEINRVASEQGDCYRGFLIKKGICGQFVVKINSGVKDGLIYASNWKDESTGKTYEDVFTVENPCAFEGSIKEGGEFYFRVTKIVNNDCMTCQAYTPVPKEKNSILVSTECEGVKN